jgi:hypothetical protein
MKLEKIIIIPDIHGRTFWRKPVKKYKNVEGVHIVFLGDYLDPYVDIDGITPEDAYCVFEEIIDEVRSANNITLLIGNHDLHYWPQFHQSYGCRRDSLRKMNISHLFQENIDLFSIAYETYINGKQYLFTHAGVLKPWFEWVTNKYVKTNPLNPDDSYRYSDVFGLTDEEIKSIDILLNAEGLNKLLHTRIGRNVLWTISKYRGGWGSYGSCLWADVAEHYSLFSKEDKYEDIYQIFSHSFGAPSLDEYIINDNWAMLDCRKPFELDCTTGKISEIL